MQYYSLPRWVYWLAALGFFALLVTGDCFYRNEIQIQDNEFLVQFELFPGKIGLALSTEISKRNLQIDKGVVSQVMSLSNAPRQATIRETFGGPRDLRPPEGLYYAGPFLVSPDGKWVATTLSHDRPSFYQAPVLAIMKRDTGEVITIWDSHGQWGVKAIAWSPDSRYVAVVRSEGGYGKCMFEILQYVFSHPKTRSDYYINIIAANGTIIAEREIMSRVRYGSATVVWES